MQSRFFVITCKYHRKIHEVLSLPFQAIAKKKTKNRRVLEIEGWVPQYHSNSRKKRPTSFRPTVKTRNVGSDRPKSSAELKSVPQKLVRPSHRRRGQKPYWSTWINFKRRQANLFGPPQFSADNGSFLALVLGAAQIISLAVSGFLSECASEEASCSNESVSFK